MYGQTYLGFMYADQIGAALVDRIKQPPSIVMVSQPDLLPISEHVDAPVVLCEPTTDESFDGSGLRSFECEGRTCWCLNISETGFELLQHHVCRFAAKLPLDEPFERIAQAIEEAHSVFRAA